MNSPIRFIDPTGGFPEFTFSVYVRAFAPFEWFGGGLWKGQDRGFSTDPSDSYRIQSYSQVTATDKDNYYPMTITRASAPVESTLYVFGYELNATSECYINDENGNYQPDSLLGGDQSLNYSLYGDNDAFPPFTDWNPSNDIDINTEMKFRYDTSMSGLADGDIAMTVTGSITGDRFPAAESFIRDSAGNSVMLGVYAISSNDSPFSHLPGNGNRPMININTTVVVNNGIFKGMLENGKTVPLADYNRRFTSQPAVRQAPPPDLFVFPNE